MIDRGCPVPLALLPSPPRAGGSDLDQFPIRMVEIETRTKCNRTCVYCPNSTHDRGDVSMPDHLFHSIVDQLQDLGFAGRMSFHFYNEPLLDDRLVDLIGYARRALPAVRIVLYTNGDRLTRQRFTDLVEAGVDIAWVTNHGSSRNHCAWRHDLPAELAGHLRYQTHQNPEIFWTNRGGLLPAVASVPEPLAVPCTAISTTLVVTAEGRVVLCYEDYEGQVTLGDLTRQSIRDVWDGDQARALRRRLATGDRTCAVPCRSCNNTEMQTLEVID
jgi:radical SAM protein with 4Fe4S-binding SPASM domain